MSAPDMFAVGFFMAWGVCGIWICALFIGGCQSALQRIARAIERSNLRD